MDTKQLSSQRRAEGMQRVSNCLASALALMATIIPFRPTIAAPVAQWHFDEPPGATLAQDSIGNYDGVLSGTAEFVTGGVSGNALSVSKSGNGLADMGDIFRFTTGDFSIVAWLKTASGDQTPSYYFVSKHRGGARAGYILGLNTDAGTGQTDKAYFFHAGSPVRVPSTTSVNDGDWHQVVGVYHANGLAEIYVDGAPAENGMSTTATLGNDAPFLVGGLDVAGLPAGTFNGLVDEVQLYDDALTPDEIQFLFEYPYYVVPESLFIRGHVPNVARPPAAHVDLMFNEAVNAGTFTPNDITLTGPEGPIAVDAPVNPVDNIWQIGFPPQWTVGSYDLQVGPHIEDLDGNEMDQDLDGAPGEDPDDRYEGSFVIADDMALSFDGDDRVIIPDAPSLNPSEITVESWVNFGRLAQPPSPTHIQSIICKGDDRSAGGYRLYQGAGPDPTLWTLRFEVLPFTNGWGTTAMVPLQTSRWHHIAGTYNGQAFQIYFDGRLVSSTDIGSVPIGNASPLYFSYHPLTSWEYYFTGEMDETRIWSVARTQEDIVRTMYVPLTGAEPGLVGYWNFNEPEGSQSVMDLSPNGNHGQLGSTPDVDFSDPLRVASGRPRAGFVEIASENNWVFGRQPGTTQSPSSGLLIKSEGGLYYYRKAYLKFDLSDPVYSGGILSGALSLTLKDFTGANQSVQVNLYGIIDADDNWSQGSITWNNAPHNNTSSYTFLGEGSTSSASARLLGQFSVAPSDSEGTTYGPFNVTPFLRWVVGQNPGYSEFAPADNDRLATILVRSNNTTEYKVPVFHSRESALSGDDKPHLDLSFRAAEDSVLCVNVHGSSYDADGVNVYETLLRAGADATFVNLDFDGEAAALIDANVYDQIWVFDLSSWTDNYPTDWQAIADWFNADPNRVIICDARMISSYWYGRWPDEGQRLSENYYENMRSRGGGLLLGTDHTSYHSGINSINVQIGLELFHGHFGLTTIPVDTANPLMTVPNDMGPELWDDSSPGQTPYGLQPNGRILYTVAWHSGNPDTPGISATIEGIVGFHVDITSPVDGATFGSGETIPFTAAPTGGDPPFGYEWFSDIDGFLGSGQSLELSTLSINDHTITVLAEDYSGRDDDDSITVSVIATPDLQVTEIDTPCAAAQGQAFEVTWTVTNNGTAPVSGAWTDQILLSDDVIIGGDTPLATFGFSDSLAVGESYARTESVTLPPGSLGEHWIVVVTDVNDDVAEYMGESNNSVIDDQSFRINLPGVVSLCSWYDVDYQGGGAGNWVISPDALSVHQTINGYPTFFVSDFDLVGSQFQGTFMVQAGAGDDDYAGFAFGFLGLGGSAVDEGYYLFSWKKGNQSHEWGFAEQGFKLMKVIGADPNLWDGEPTPGQIEMLARYTYPDGAPGWQHGVEYEFFLMYQANGSVRVIIRRADNGAEVWNTGLITDPEPLGPGKVGFWNFSQPHVIYSSFTQAELEPPVAVAGGPYLLDASMADLTLDATGSFDPDGALGGFDDIASLQWDLGNDGIEDDEGRTDPHQIVSFEDVFAKGLALSVDVPTGLTVLDADGLEGSDIGVIQYSNSPPTADAGGPYGPVYPGTSVHLLGDVDDPDLATGVGEFLVVEWDVTPATQASDVGDGFANQPVVEVPYETLLPLHRDYGETFYLNVVDVSGSVASSATTIELALPDLAPIELIIPVEGTAGGQITVEWTGLNYGVAAAVGPWKDGVYLSEDDQWGNDQLLGEFTFNDTLEPDETYRRVSTVSLPGFTEGDYWLIVVVDNDNEIYEPNEGADNRLVSTSSIQIWLQPYPDLMVAALAVPEDAWAGQDVDICWAVTNVGNGPTATPVWYDSVYLSFDAAIGFGDIGLGVFENHSSLEPGGSYEQCQTVSIPANALACYYFIVRADYANAVFEYRSDLNAEANNDLPAYGCTDVTLPPPADLIVTTVSAPFFSMSGDPITVWWEVMNDGQSPTPTGYWVDSIYISLDQTLGADDVRLCNVAHSGALNAGGSYVSETTCDLPRWIEGDYYVFVRTDSSNHVPEQGFEGNNNNYDASPMEVELVSPPDLEVDTLTVTGDETSGGTITVVWSVMNFGGGPTEESRWHDSIYLSQDEFFTTPQDNVRLGGPYLHQGFLEPDESYERNVTVDLPHCIEGAYHIFVVCDVSDEVEEYYDEYEQNNDDAFTSLSIAWREANLAVSGVTAPTSGTSSQPIAVSWTVTNVGNAPTNTSHHIDRIYLSPDEALDPENDTLLDSRTFTGVLGVGDSHTVEDHTVTLPAGTSGNYFVFVLTNAEANVEECGHTEDNANYDVNGIDIAFTEADLVVDVVEAPATGSSGQAIEVTWTVTNVGDRGTVVFGWTDKVYLSADPVASPGDDILLGTFEYFGLLDPGEWYEAVTAVVLPARVAGVQYVIVCADADDDVSEPQGEDNNCTASEAITIAAVDPDLAVTSVSAATEGQSGDVIQVSWQVENAGERATSELTWADAIYISANEALDVGDRLLGTFTHDGALDVDELYLEERAVTLAANTSGSFFIIVKADSEDDVFESGSEANNVNHDPAGIVVTCIEPDLAAVAITAPAQADAGLPIDVSWQVTNTGDRPTAAGGWIDVLYLSQDPVFNEDTDPELGSYSWNNLLETGESYVREVTVELPNGISGAHYVFVRTDTEDDVLECGLSANNVSDPPALVSVEITEVDLQVASITAPDEGYAGQEVIVEWSVVNAGASATPNGNWRDNVYLSLDTFLDPGVDPALGYATRAEPLAAGVSYDTGGTFTIPVGTPPGNYYVLVATDGTNAVYEHEAENNNLSASDTQAPVYELLTADLLVTDVVVPLTASPGLPATFSWVVTNQGANAAVGSWYDSIYLSTDTEWNLGDAFVAKVRHQGTVQPGESYDGTTTARVPGVVPVPHYVIIRGDINNHIPEDEGEDNNITASTEPVDMLITALELGVPFEAEQTGGGLAHYYQVTVPADETLQVTLDAQYPTGANELYIKYDSTPLRGTDFDDSHDNPFLPDQRVTIPTTRAGTYYILVYGDYVPNPPQTYVILAESVPFGITELTPSEGSNTTDVTVEIMGARFTEDTGFSLITVDNQEMWPERVYPFDSATAYATFNLVGTTAGLADARAETPEGVEDTAIDAFDILPGGAAQLGGRIVAPSSVRAGRAFGIRIDYGNLGVGDMPAPLIELRSSRPLYASTKPEGPFHPTPIRILGVSSEGPAGILAPGRQGTVPIYIQGTSAGALRLGLVRRSGNERIDWEAMEALLRPADVSDLQWEAVWNRLVDHVGDTWGEYEQAMGDVATRLWLDGLLVYDVTGLFAQELELAWMLYPSRISGVVVDAETSESLPHVALVARFDDDGDGVADVVAQSTSASAGAFEFRVSAGIYEIYAEGYYFDPPATVVVDTDVDVLGLTLQAVTVPLPPVFEQQELSDTSPSLTTDAEENAHLAWRRGGGLHHAVFDGTGWDITGPVADAAGVTPRIAYDPNNPEGNGVTAAWQQGFGNEAEILYSVGSSSPHGSGYEWTTPTAVVSDSYSDDWPAIAYLSNGEMMVVWLKKDAEIPDGDDTEVYWATLVVTGGTPYQVRSLPDCPCSAGCSPGGGEFCKDVTLGTGKSLPSWVPIIGGKYGFRVAGQLCGELDCDPNIGGQVEVQVDFSDNACGAGCLGGSAHWKTNVEACEWVFDRAELNIGVGGCGTIPAHRWPIVSVPGLFVEVGANLVGNLNGTMIWQGTNFPSWPTGGHVDLTLGADPYGQIYYISESLARVRIDGEGRVTGRYVPPQSFSIANWCLLVKGELYVWGLIHFELCKKWGGCDAYGISCPSLLPDRADYRTFLAERAYVLDGIPIFETVTMTVDPWSGTGNVYPGSTVLADVSADLKTDGPPSVAVGSSGETLTAWTKDSPDPHVAIGSSLVVASFNGVAWDAPVEVASTDSFNADANVVLDDAGTPLLVWSSASALDVGIDSTVADILAARHDSDIYFAVRDGGTWSAPAPVAVLPGADRNVRAAARGVDEAVAAWLHSEGGPTTLYAAIWDGDAWNSATQVSQTEECLSVVCTYAQGLPLVVWEVDEDGDLESEFDRILYFSVWNGAWSSPVALPKDDGARVQNDDAVQSAGLRGIPIPPPLDEECCWECEHDDECNDNVACTEDRCVDHICRSEPRDAWCDDGQFCNGVEKCDPDNPNADRDGCVAGEEPCSQDEICLEDEDRCVECVDASDCNDGISCTEDTCVNNDCEHSRDDDFCDDGLYCNGTETCRPEHSGDASGCAGGTNPCPPDSECSEGPNGPICACETPEDCNDAIACTEDACVGNECQNIPDHESCNDGLFCTGEERCNSLRNGHPWDGRGCVSDGNPCPPGLICDEEDDECRGCQDDGDCADSVGCTEDTCEASGACSHSPNDELCDDNNVCNGKEWCDQEQHCQSGEPLACPDGDECLNVWCDPEKGCQSEVLDCNDGPDVDRPVDPNEKVAPEGYGLEKWVAVGEEMLYTVYFENLPEATAPAQTVTITDRLSADLDWRTFRVGDLGFGDELLTVPGNRSYLQADVDLMDKIGLIVRIIVGVDIPTGEARWRFISIDPATGEPTTDPGHGFLPPNDPDIGSGEGFVTFRVRPREEVETGTEIPNDATIVFDSLDAIDTNEVFNTIDADAPSSAVDPVPPEMPGPDIPLTWFGGDSEGGSGLASFSVYSSVDDGPFVPFVPYTSETSGLLHGAFGHVYAFYSRASDHVGNTENPPEVPDARIALFDCNDNGICDTADIAIGSSDDVNGNGVPDECDCWANADCDDGNPCTLDVCGATAACENPNLADGTPCNDDLFCNGEELCQNGACQPGGGICTDPCHLYCDEDSDSCAWCILDLNRSGLVDGPDFGFFSGCFGQCYLPEDACAVSNFDGDPNVCVGSGDFGGFAGCFAYSCGECDNCAGPSGARGAVASTVVDAGGASVQLIAVASPTESDFADVLPASRSTFRVKERFDLEVWATRDTARGDAAKGFAAAYVDVDYDPALLEADGIIHSEAFANLTWGTIDPEVGTVTAVGGCAAFGDNGLGVTPRWVRVATIGMRTAASGATAVRPRQAAEPYGVSLVDRFGNLDGSQLSLGATRLQIRKLYDPRRLRDKRGR